MSGLQKLSFAIVAVFVVASGYYYYSSRAATEIALTLTTNPDLERGLVGHWTFDGPDVDWGSTTAEIRDRSGQGNHGNATTTMNASSAGIGVIGQAMNFDGVNSFIATNVANTYDSFNSGSVAFWFKTSTTTFDADQTMINYGSSNSDAVISWGVDEGGRLIQGWKPSGIWAWIAATPTPPFVSDTWYHAVFAADGVTKVKTYLNGQEIQNQFYQQGADGTESDFFADVTGTSTSNHSLHMGQMFRSSGFANKFDGALDDARVYNRALSAEEIKRLYELGATTKIAETLTTNPDLERGLVGHWTFDGPDVDWSSTTAEIRDRSGQGNHGNALGSISPTSATQGIIAQGMSFNGDGEYITVDQTWKDTLTNFSVAFWMRPDDLNSRNIFYNLNGHGIYPRLWILGSTPYLGYQHFTVEGVSSDFVDASSGLTLATSTWYHVVLTLDNEGGNILRTYINGTYLQQENMPDGTLRGGTSDMYIGYDGDADKYDFKGAMDDFRVYNRALSAEEVKRLYGLGATTKIGQTLSNPTLETGLVGHWTFDGPDFTDKVYDRSGQAHHGYVAGTATSSVKTSGVIGQGFKVATSNDAISIPDASDFDLVGKSFSFAFWFKPGTDLQAIGDNWYDRRAILAKGDLPQSGNTDNAYMIFYQGDGDNIFFEYWTGTTWKEGTTTSLVLPEGVWHHGVVTYDYDTSTFIWYIDGVFNNKTESADPLFQNNALPLQLGKFTITNTRYWSWEGSLDDFRVYNRALSANEVKRLYDLGQ